MKEKGVRSGSSGSRVRRQHGQIQLRSVRESDLPLFYEHQRDPIAYEMVGFTPRDHEAFMAHWHKIMADRSNVIKTIVVGGEIAGNVLSFMRGDTREVGYWLGREFWGKGIATTALSLFLQRVKVRPLFAGVAKHNVGSIKVLEKCGFSLLTQEGEECLFQLK